MDLLNQDDIKVKSVLVLGCNNGHDCFMCGERGAARVLGVDINEDWISYAKRMNKHYNLPVEFQSTNLREPFDAGKFDTILAFAVYASIGDILAETLYNGTVSYFEGHRLPHITEYEYRINYFPLFKHFRADPIAKTDNETRWLYRLTR